MGRSLTEREGDDPDLLTALAARLDEPNDALADPVSSWLRCGPFEKDDQQATVA